MSSNHSKPWDRRSGQRRFEITNRRRVIILCEDEKSSCFYFSAFPIDRSLVEVLALGTGFNTHTLVEEAIHRKSNAEAAREPFNEVWCVLDRDSFPLANFDRAFQLARSNGIHIAWANEAFELWYLLHFHYHDTGISRTEYSSRLEKLTGEPYNKADKQVYGKLRARMQMALKNARRLEQHWAELNEPHPERQNPSTSVHKLVDFLNRFLEDTP
jgi:hypothetical protein